jgi:hypothetical protein
MRRFVFAATVSAVALMSGASLAQSGPELRIGASVDGALDASDPQAENDGEAYRYEDFTVRARRGQRLEAIARSDAFDTYLEVYAPGGGDEALAEDDDGLGEGTNSRLRFTAPEDGAYRLRVRTFSGLDGGAYSLSLAQRPDAPRAPRPGSIRVGQTIEGEISDSDPEAEDDENRYDAYAFRAAAGQRYAVSLNAEDFDPVVRVGQMERGAFVELAANDDGVGIGVNSYLIFTAPRAGEYVIRATPLTSDGEGAYTLKLDEAPPPLPTTPIRLGETVGGELTKNDGVNDGGARADAYAFTATAGQRVEVTMKSDAFDAYLELFDPSGESIAQNDDGGDGTNSRLIATLKEAGVYRIEARALGADPTGAYRLALAEAEPEPEPTPLPFATLTQGEIRAEGPRDDDGRPYAAYSFSGREGTRVQVVMRSGDFDAYLQLSKAGDSEILATDDDGLGEGTDSRLNFILPETGDYVIRASALGSDEKGLYSIEVTDRGPQPEPGSILIGATARGTLSDNDGLADDGAYFDAYRITVAAGDKLNVTLVSNDFDAYLDIGRDKDGAWESVASDDDGLSDTHAKVEWTVETAGTYVIRARSFAQGGTGAYALTVERRN